MYHPAVKLGVALVALGSLVGCGYAIPSIRHINTVDTAGEEAPECRIPIYRSTIPDRPFHEIGVVEAFAGGVVTHADSSMLSRSVMDLRKRGCELGADALIELERTDRGGVIATAVVFDDAPGEVPQSTPAP